MYYVSMVCFSRTIEQHKQVYDCEANDVGVLYTERTKFFTCLQALIITW